MIRIPGENLGTDPDAIAVYFDGEPAQVVDLTATELVVRPPASHPGGWAAISVELANQMSNAAFFELVPSGTPRAEATLLPSRPNAVVQIGDEVFIAASDPYSAGAGLYRLAADGVLSRVWDPPSWPWPTPTGVADVRDTPTCLTVSDGDVWFATTFGSVYRFSPQTGRAARVEGRISSFSEFANITGIARTPGGMLILVQQPNLVLFLPEDATWWGAMGGGSFQAAYGIVMDGVDAFVTVANGVVRLNNPDVTWTSATTFATGAEYPRGIAVMNEQLVVSDQHGALLVASKATTGTFQPYLTSSVLRWSQAAGLFVNEANAILAAQPSAQVVRSVTGTGALATQSILAAGLLPTFGVAREGGTTWLAMSSWVWDEASFDDAVLVALEADGTSRILTRGRFFTGLALLALPAGDRLALSDRDAKTISLVDPSSGTRQEILGPSQGLDCPMGLTQSAEGELLYVDCALAEEDEGRVGRWIGDQHTPNFVTGVGDAVSTVVRAGDAILVGAIGEFGLDGIYRAAATGGAASLLLPRQLVDDLIALAVSPEGTVYASTWGGGIVVIDLETKESRLYGSIRLPSSQAFSTAYALTFAESGALVAPDNGQRELVLVAP